jgi:hypothetical protein
MRRTHPLLAVLAAVLALAAANPAAALVTATLRASLKPEQLGGETTVGFGFHLTERDHQLPPPLTGFELRYPVQLGFAVSELGLDTCSAKTLQLHGPHGCPTNSIMGHGTALGELAVDGEVVYEEGFLTVVRTSDPSGHLALLFFTDAYTPVLDELVFNGALLPASPPFGGRLTVDVPLLESYAYGPDISVVSFRSTIGPQDLTYNEHIHGKLIHYKPRGIAIPNKCPHRGFLFTAHFTFQDQTQTSSQTTVPCPGTRSGKSPSGRGGV